MAVQDAELQLKVSLDLSFFRQQLSGLGQAAAGYNVPINIKFDRRSVQNELNALGRNISQRTYRLEVATNISQEIKNAGTLAKALRGLDNAIQKSRGVANRAAGGPVGATANAGRVEALINRATKPALQALYGEMSKASIPMADVGKGTVDSLRRAILSGVPQLTADLAQGIANGLDPKMKENGTSSAKLFVDAFKSATGIASPSKVFKALGEFSADGLEIGFLNGLKDFKTKAIGEIKQIAALMKLELASVGDVRIGPGTGAARAGARGGRQYMNPIGPLPTGSREPWAFSQYRYQPFMAQPGQVRGAGVPAMRTRQPFLPAPSVMGTTSSPSMLGQARLALPAAGETSAVAMREAALALREIAARQRSDARSASVMGENRMWSRVAGQVPVGAGGPFLPSGAGSGVPPRPPSGGGGGGMGGMGGFGRALGGINLPGTGVVREIGNEFAMATKQVLLFGTAYKALALLTSFPAQVGQAVGALQSFNNTLKAISPTAEEARASNQFILDIVDRYNVPLQSARDGFTKLYASMAPAGFQGDEIRDLFTGVSQAAATFGMSADKVDRVNYAFAQMASKGQVMSEELKGQLGDVLPGAMGIFAEAAGMEGPDAIQKFSEALEDGAYKGEAMRVLLKNVSVVLTKEFGPGAEGAARTFQGVINRMQNSTQLLYEAFEPVAVSFLNSVVVPLTSGIKTITDGFNAFFTGTQAKTAGGMAFAQELERLRPTFEGIRANAVALVPTLQNLGGTLLEISKIFLQIAGNPFVGYLARVYLSVLPLVAIIKALSLQALVPMIGNLLRAIPAFITFNSLMLQGNRAGLALKTTTFLLGSTSAVTAGQVRLVGTALLSLGLPAVLLGIGALIERFMMLKGAVDGVRQSTQQMVGSISSLANTGAVREIKNIGADTQKQVSTFKSLQPFVSGGFGNTPQQRLTEGAAKKMEELGLGSFVSRGVTGPYVNDFLNASKIIEERLKGLGKTADSVREKLPLAQKAAAALAKQAKQGIEPMPEGVGVTSAKEKTKKERESQLPMLQLELDKTKELFAIDQQLIGARLADNASLVSSLELQKQLTELKYQGKQIALEQIPLDEKQAKMAALAVEYEKAIMESQLNLQLDMQKAREDLQRSVEDTVKGYELENQYQQRYYELVQQGIGPALAKIRVEVEKTFRKEEERVDTLMEQYQLQKASLEVQLAALLAQGNLSKVDSLRLDYIKERIRLLDIELEKMGLLKGSLPGAQTGAITAAEGATQPAPARVRLEELAEESRLALEKLQDPVEQIKTISAAISQSIGSAFKGLITGATTAQEALANVFQSIADSFADMVAQMITEWLRAQLIKGFMSLFPGGSALSGATSAASTGLSFDPGGMASFNAPWTFANGGIATGGFRAFANGGIVTGPTLGLVGEGRYNEAVIPLPDGKSVPVDLGGAMAGTGGEISTNIVINVNNGQMQSEGGGNASSLGRKMEGAVKQVIVNELRPGGVLAGRR